jgi:hypothetical protein
MLRVARNTAQPSTTNDLRVKNGIRGHPLLRRKVAIDISARGLPTESRQRKEPIYGHSIGGVRGAPA